MYSQPIIQHEAVGGVSQPPSAAQKWNANCPDTPNPGQEDSNSNGIGDVCDGCCIGDRGDVNSDSVDADPVDLSYLVDFLFGGSPRL